MGNWQLVCNKICKQKPDQLPETFFLDILNDWEARFFFFFLFETVLVKPVVIVIDFAFFVR